MQNDPTNMLDSAAKLSNRRKTWESYFQRYEGASDDINKLSDDDNILINTSLSDMQGIKVTSIPNQVNIVEYIDKKLNSNLKKLLISNMKYKMLKSSKYEYWHNETKKELRKLTKFVSSSDLESYMSYMAKQISKIRRDPVSHNLLHKSLFETLLLKKEMLSNSIGKEKECQQVCEALEVEWQHWSTIIPPEYMLHYAKKVVRKFRKSH